MLAGPDPLVVLHMPGERTQDDLLHNISRHQGQADRPVVPRILLPTVLSLFLILAGNVLPCIQ